MKKPTHLFYIILITFFCTSCKKEDIKLSTNASDVFWVTNNGSDMPIWVKGNTYSNVIILIIHGGPGDGAYDFSGSETNLLRNKYAVAFWDQRNAGASSGKDNISKLNFPQMVSDMEAVVQVLKHRYPSSEIFLYAHSFGGLLASAYLVKDNNQQHIKGFIDIDGAHNYPLCNSLSRKMLLDSGNLQINKGNYKQQWLRIVNYCSVNDPLTSFSISTQVEAFAHEAESYMGVNNSLQNNYFTPEDPFAYLSNYFRLYYTSSGNQFIQSLERAEYSDQLGKIVIPTILLWGKYDFTVPPGVANDALDHLSSSYKKLIIFSNSGHRPMQTESIALQNEIINFAELFK